MSKELNEAFVGFHNENLPEERTRIIKGNSYKELSTVWVTPTRGLVPFKVVSSWFAMMKPMNQQVIGPIGLEGMEVAEAYNQGVQMILDHPQLSKYKYLLSIEEDNCPPSDGLLKLYENIEEYDAVSGLYWTKGYGGQPMCYGSPKVMPKNFIPQPPPIDCVKEYNGLGQGFCLYKLDMFRKVDKPWFKTVQSTEEGLGTQDLYFFSKAAKYGFKFAVDGRVKVGHWDQSSQTMW
jgi:hypothetical protein